MANNDKYPINPNAPITRLKGSKALEIDPRTQYIYGKRLIRPERPDNHKPDEKLGLTYIERSAENGYVEAEYWLAQRYLNPHLTPTEPQLKQRGLELLESAALKYHFGAAISLGYLHFNQGDLHNSKMATSVWETAIETVFPGNPTRSSSFFMYELSEMFNKGAYGQPKKWPLSGQLHILSGYSSLQEQKKRDIFLVLSDIAVEQPALFQRMIKAGLTWPTPQEMTGLIASGDAKPNILLQRKSTDICNKLLFISKIPHIQRELTAYLQGELPDEIAAIPNLKFGL